MKLRENLNVDSLGNKLSKEQVEYFKNSKVRDNNNNLLVCYHFSNKSFSSFNTNKSEGGFMGEGLYFSSIENWANDYDDIKYEVYLNIKNPFIFDGYSNTWKAFLDEHNIEYDKSLFEEDYPLDDIDDIDEVEMIDDTIGLENLTTLMKKYGYDGIIWYSNMEYIAYYPEQIKLITNKNPSKSINMNEDVEVHFTKEDLKREAIKWLKENNQSDDKWSHRGFILPDGYITTNPEEYEDNYIPHRYVDAKFTNYLEDEFGWSISDIEELLNHDINQYYGNGMLLVMDNLGFIRVNGSGENYILLPKDKPNRIQLNALSDWIDEFFERTNYSKKILVEVTYGFSDATYYSPDNYTGKDIVKKIVSYYNTGNLNEDLDDEDFDDDSWDEDEQEDLRMGKVIDEIANEISKTSDINTLFRDYGFSFTSQVKDGPSFIFTDGSILNCAENTNSKFDILHTDIVDEIIVKKFNEMFNANLELFELDDLIEDYGYELNLLDLILSKGVIRINTGTTRAEPRSYCVLTSKYKPTKEQEDSLLKYFDFLFNKGKNSVEVFIMKGNYPVIHDYNLVDNLSEDIIKKIRRFYSTGELVETKEESKNNVNELDSKGNQLSKEQVEYFINSKVRDEKGNLLICYHGTPNPGFKEFKPAQSKSQFGQYKFKKSNVNYFTSDFETAQGYTEIGVGDDYSTGKDYKNIYACYLNIVNPYIVDNTTEAEIKTWGNIKDKNIRQKQLNSFERMFNKWSNKYITNKDLDKINKDLYPFGYELRVAEEADLDDDVVDLWKLDNNTMYGKEHIVMYSYDLIDLFDKDSYGEDFRERVIGTKDEVDDYVLSVDDIVKWVLIQNEEEGTNYDGIIVKDIADVGPKGSAFTTMPGTDIVTLKSSNQIKLVSNKKPTQSTRIDERANTRRKIHANR